MAAHSIQRAEGIILRAVPFRDYDHILTIFTEEVGIIKVLYYGSRSRKRGAGGLCMPLTKVEVDYRDRGGDIFICQEMALLEPYSFLRSNLSWLEAGCDLLNVVYLSQFTGKPSTGLYNLLVKFLEKIPSVTVLSALAVSFRLKLLCHDGFTTIPFVCSECREQLVVTAYTQQSEGWCSVHRPIGCEVWSNKSLAQVYHLAGSRSFAEISAEHVSIELQRQVVRLFESCLCIHF
jgi:DNA repair protein RecO